jgi:hypothetical protein
MIRCGRQANVAGKFDLVSKTRNKRNDRAWQICVDQKAHTALSGGKWVKGLLLGKLADESGRGSNIISSQIVLALNFFKSHPAGEAPNHGRHWNTRATNDGFPVADSRIDNDAVLTLPGDSNITGFAQLVEISVLPGAIPQVVDCRPLFFRVPAVDSPFTDLAPIDIVRSFFADIEYALAAGRTPNTSCS